MSDRLLSPEAVANTYVEGWEAVQDHVLWEAWRDAHPEQGPARASDSLGFESARLKAWHEGSAPRAATALRTARRHGWVQIPPDSARARYLAGLLAWSQAEGRAPGEGPKFVPSFYAQGSDGERRLRYLTSQLDIEIRPEKDGANQSARKALYRVANDGNLFGRCLAVLRGDRATLPEAIATHPDSSLGKRYVATWLRASTHDESADVLWVRPPTEPRVNELATAIERVIGDNVQAAEETILVPAADAVTLIENVTEFPGPERDWKSSTGN